VKASRFRGDLFDRLHVFPIVVPPLRERPGDVAPLRHFLVPFAAEEGKRIRLIAPDALRLLAAFHRPDNVRQLENEVFRAVVLAGDSLAQARGFGVRAVCSLRDAGVAREQQTEPGPVAPERQKRKIA
jgi:transcriptional regulator with GAF, ATPase, and Fis domain